MAMCQRISRIRELPAPLRQFGCHEGYASGISIEMDRIAWLLETTEFSIIDSSEYRRLPDCEGVVCQRTPWKSSLATTPCYAQHDAAACPRSHLKGDSKKW